MKTSAKEFHSNYYIFCKKTTPLKRPLLGDPKDGLTFPKIGLNSGIIRNKHLIVWLSVCFDFANLFKRIRKVALLRLWWKTFHHENIPK